MISHPSQSLERRLHRLCVFHVFRKPRAKTSLQPRVEALVSVHGDPGFVVSCASCPVRCTPKQSPRSPVHALRKSHERVRASLAEGQKQQKQRGKGDGSAVDVRSWSASQLTGAEGQDPSKAWSFKDFEKRLQSGEPVRSAFLAPSSLPPLPSGIEAGPFPTLEEVLSRVGRCF